MIAGKPDTALILSENAGAAEQLGEHALLMNTAGRVAARAGQ